MTLEQKLSIAQCTAFVLVQHSHFAGARHSLSFMTEICAREIE
jgi:hypothetical protein